MESKILAEFCAQKCFEKKAENVLILDISKNSSVADYYVIASGYSDRQVSAIAEHIADSMHAAGFKPSNKEGLADGRWALVDFGSVIVHIFQDSLRDHYSIESLFVGAPRIRPQEKSSQSTSNYSSGHASL